MYILLMVCSILLRQVSCFCGACDFIFKIAQKNKMADSITVESLKNKLLNDLPATHVEIVDKSPVSLRTKLIISCIIFS